MVATAEKPVAIIDEVVGAAVMAEELEAELQAEETQEGGEVWEDNSQDTTPQAYVPPDDIFPAQPQPDWYFGDKKLTKIGQEMVKKFPELVGISQFRIKYVWKRKGGMDKGQPRLGGVVRGNSLLRQLGDTDFVIWLAADHCRDFTVTELQRDANLFHQLCHAAVDEQGKPFVQGHDLEMFEAEVERYGLWSTSLKRSAPVIQAALPGIE